jgi:hypothetical protein
MVADLAGPIAALAVEGKAQAELETLARQLNPVLGYFDPLNLAGSQFWGTTDDKTIGFLRHAEIKHGRVAMAGFVGFCVHANGIHFPWKVPGDELCAPGVSPVALWQNIPDEAKYQIILTIGLFEFYSEVAVSKAPELGGHYMRGGKPGFFPPFKAPKGTGTNGCYADVEGNPLLPHPVPLNLFDPFEFGKKKTDEQKARGLQIEINNGRLAMIGLMGFLSEGAIPGAVPALKGIVPSSGAVNVMRPFDMDVTAGLESIYATLAVQGKNVPEESARVAMLAVAGETLEDLKGLAKKLNPAVGYFDPLMLSEGEFWGTSNEATIGWLRHSEIKHGRVAMAGFVGFCVHANGIHWPWKVPGDEIVAPGVSPVALWQNIPDEAKYQIILTMGLFEYYSEVAVSKSPGMGGHYMRGGKPGFFPPFKAPKGIGYKGIPTDDEGNALLPHPVPFNLYDPFNVSSNMSAEDKARRLQMEINNGRLAMIGLMGFLAEGAIPGSVPALKGLIPASGPVNVMSPFDMASDIGAKTAVGGLAG